MHKYLYYLVLSCIYALISSWYSLPTYVCVYQVHMHTIQCGHPGMFKQFRLHWVYIINEMYFYYKLEL